MRELWLIRHGETRANLEKRYPAADATLTETGRAQARAMVPFLEQVTFDRVLSSPLIRALETARECGFTPDADDRLRELEYGVFTGHTWLEIEAQYGSEALKWLEHMSNPLSSEGVPGGESGLGFHARAGSFLEGVPLGRTLAFTHGGFIRALLTLGLKLSAVDLEPGSLTVLRQMGKVWGLSRLNAGARFQ